MIRATRLLLAVLFAGSFVIMTAPSAAAYYPSTPAPTHIPPHVWYWSGWYSTHAGCVAFGMYMFNNRMVANDYCAELSNGQGWDLWLAPLDGGMN